MTIPRTFGSVIAGLLLVALPTLAHHSFQAEYDENKLVTVSGTVTKVAWTNPHVMLNMDVREASGKVANWQMELASPNGLLRQGWRVDSLKPGDQVMVSGYAARDGSHLVNARRVTLGGKAYSTIKDDK
ncbi:MAG: DUF6152 family protein [Acidobacteriota bacterium]|nr:DUF6152 family protein [Acidobacteriota bacterium]